MGCVITRWIKLEIIQSIQVTSLLFPWTFIDRPTL